MEKYFNKRFGKGWLFLSIALLLHIIDEAVNGFLPVYNRNVLRIRASTGIPIPTFTFNIWLAGLISVEVLLLFLSRYAFQGRRMIVLLAFPFAVIMFLNGLVHLAGSFYMKEWMPGIITAPLLVFGSVNLFLITLKIQSGRRIAAKLHS